MPRRNLQFLPDHYYHIYNRGAGQQSIYRKEGDYAHCLKTLKAVAGECNIVIIAYCLMPNHYHWLVRQVGETSAGELPARVFKSYSQWFNLVHKRSGTLFESRFKVRLVATDEYLRHLCRYIHLNPVQAGFAAAPELWPYSNYQDWLGLRHELAVDHAFIQRFFTDPQHYKSFVLDFLTGKAKPPSALTAYFDTLWD